MLLFQLRFPPGLELMARARKLHFGWLSLGWELCQDYKMLDSTPDPSGPVYLGRPSQGLRCAISTNERLTLGRHNFDMSLVQDYLDVIPRRHRHAVVNS